MYCTSNYTLPVHPGSSDESDPEMSHVTRTCAFMPVVAAPPPVCRKSAWTGAPTCNGNDQPPQTRHPERHTRTQSQPDGSPGPCLADLSPPAHYHCQGAAAAGAVTGGSKGCHAHPQLWHAAARHALVEGNGARHACAGRCPQSYL